eukprot:s7362_g2.t1
MGRLSVGTSGWCGLHPKDFGRRYDMVEFNWTFHERDHDGAHYRKATYSVLSACLKGFFSSEAAVYPLKLEELFPNAERKGSSLKDRLSEPCPRSVHQAPAKGRPRVWKASLASVEHQL